MWHRSKDASHRFDRRTAYASGKRRSIHYVSYRVSSAAPRYDDTITVRAPRARRLDARPKRIHRPRAGGRPAPPGAGRAAPHGERGAPRRTPRRRTRAARDGGFGAYLGVRSNAHVIARMRDVRDVDVRDVRDVETLRRSSSPECVCGVKDPFARALVSRDSKKSSSDGTDDETGNADAAAAPAHEACTKSDFARTSALVASNTPSRRETSSSSTSERSNPRVADFARRPGFRPPREV